MDADDRRNLETSILDFEYVSDLKAQRTVIRAYHGQASDVVVPADINGFPVEEIGPGAFAKSTVDSVDLPYSLISIGPMAFANCVNLQYVTLPDGIREIGAQAFENCMSLLKLHIPDSMTEICTRSFKNCQALLCLAIPDNVSKIGTAAFSQCSSLQDVTFSNQINMIGAQAFTDTPWIERTDPGAELVRKDHLLIYRQFAILECLDKRVEQIVVPEGITVIGDRKSVV